MLNVFVNHILDSVDIVRNDGLGGLFSVGGEGLNEQPIVLP